MKVLIVGFSTRAMVQSAVRAGWDVVSLDFFGDDDQPKNAEVYSLVRDFHKPPELRYLAEVAFQLEQKVDAVLVESGLENEPALQHLGAGCERWYNTPEAVCGVRDLSKLSEVLSGCDMGIPEIVLHGESPPTEGRWLLKDSRHSGGMGVQDWGSRQRIGKDEVLERFIPGQLASACFVANGKQARLLGMTLQYVGVPELNARPYAWCGNAAPFIEQALARAVLDAAEILTMSFGLVGVNGIDFIVQDGEPYVLEVNPRIPASVELFERLLGVNAFGVHVQGCRGELPQLPAITNTRSAWGKGILYTKKRIRVGDTSGWANQGIADVPHTDEEIPKGAPICTLLAQGDDVRSCWELVIQKSKSLLEIIE